MASLTLLCLNETSFQVSRGSRNAVVQAESYCIRRDSDFARDLIWYLEKHAIDAPFEETRASKVADKIRAYAKYMVQAILSSKLMPKRARKLLFEVLPCEGALPNGSEVYWEIIASRELWGRLDGFDFGTVGVVRSLPFVADPGSLADDMSRLSVHRARTRPRRGGLRRSSNINILVISARPAGDEDIQFRLISKSLMHTFAQIRRQSAHSIKIDFLRPATWDNFKNHIDEQLAAGRVYDIVHFDVHGQVEDKG